MLAPTRMLMVLAAATMYTLPSMPAADYPATVLSTPNLLGYWRFTTASGANSVVNGYTGTFNGNAALGAPGSGPYLEADPANRPVALDGSSGTFVNTNLVGGINTGGSIVGFFNLASLPSSSHTFTIAGQSQGGNDFDLQIDTDDRIRFYTSSGGGVTSTNALTAADLNSWHFVAATFTANGRRNLYIDNQPVVSEDANNHSAGNGTFAIGESNVFQGRFFNGALDEIAVWNRELTATEIATIHAAVPEPTVLLLAGLTAIGLRKYRASMLRNRN